MNRKYLLCTVSLAGVFALALPATTFADDGSASDSIAAGGLVFTREPRIVMAKEVLKITLKKVEVDYDFRNDTDEKITTEVAFPVPPYANQGPVGEGTDPASLAFESFRLWVNGKAAPYKTEARAMVNDRDVSDVLRANRIDIPSLGHYEEVQSGNQGCVTRDFDQMPKQVRDELVQQGLFGEGNGCIQSAWKINLKYYWTQSFPAHSTVHIRHEYTPVAGYQRISRSTAGIYDGAHQPIRTFLHESTDSFCPDESLLRSMENMLTANDPNSVGGAVNWVDFILTTANTWRQPIEDFTLVVERPKPEQDRKMLISLCSSKNGKVEKLDAEHFQLHLTNFVPSAELHIGFFDLPKLAPPTAGK